MSALLLTVWLAGAVAVAGEAPEPDPAWGHIVNGREVKGKNFPAAVAIGVEFQGYRMATCTASLITPRMLLTAAHCTEELGVPKDLIVQVGAAFFGNEVNGSGVRTVKFADFRAHPDYPAGSQQPLNDIGVIELAEEVDWVEPVWFRQTPVTDAELNHELISVGYGITSSSAQNSSGIKRVANLRLGMVDNQFLYSFARDNPDRSNLCSGDSGGPQYVRLEDGRLEQWGIHSFVFGASGDPCLSASGSTNIGSFNAWLTKQIERVHGTSDRCEILGVYDGFDRICDTSCDEPDPDCEFDANGDGRLDDEEFGAIDRDGDGDVTDDELDRARRGGCDHTGGLGGGLALVGFVALATRRRHPTA